ncbi:MAG: DUF1800 domain-containing protein [Thermodesulfobacteriota bacterium]
MVDWNEDNVLHLLSRAGFGAKHKEATTWVRRGQALTVELLVAQKGVKAKGPGGPVADPTSVGKLQQWWTKRMATQNLRRLQEKMCLFWHDHFATQVAVVKNVRQMSYQNRTFREHGLGPFKTLVHQVTRDAAMLEFLDGKLNTKNKPNENYGRELMELFVLGVFDLNGVENYTQTDVEQLTRCCSGYQIDRDKDVGFFNPQRFDNGTKTLFAGKPYQATGNIGFEDANGDLLPPERNVIDILFAHRDSDGELTMPRFLARKLWEYFAYPDPDKSLVDEIAAPFVAGGFVVRDLLRAIFLHDEFYSEQAKTSTVKNPVEFALGAMRALKAGSNYGQIPAHLEAMGMELFNPPSVNGWSNGTSWLSTGQFLNRFAFAQTLAAGRDSKLVKITPKQIFDDDATSADQVVDGFLVRLGVAARTPADVRQALIDYVNDPAPPASFADDAVIEKKVRGVLALILQLPELHIH